MNCEGNRFGFGEKLAIASYGVSLLMSAQGPQPSLGSFPELNIVLGAYDATVVGLQLSQDSDELLALEARFAYAPHAASVRAVAAHGQLLASASADETVRIYDMGRGVETSVFTSHSGSVNALAMFRDPLAKTPMLVSASSDMTLGVTQVSTGILLKQLTGHTAPVTDVAVHPTARVALSLAADRSLFMWNLLRGKVAFSAKTKPGPASSVAWSPSGERYLLNSDNITALYSAEGTLESIFEHKGAVLSAAFLDDQRVVTGGEEKVVQIWDVRGRDVVASPAKHDMRVRAVATAPGVVISADTAGGVKIWDEKRGGSPRLETEIGGGGMRVTCMAAGLQRVTTSSETRKRRKAGRVGRAAEEAKQVEGDPKTGTASSRKRQKRKEARG